MSHFHRLLFIGLIGIAACGKGGPNFADAGGTDANQLDAQVPDTTPPDTSITKQPPALTNSATAHFEFASTEDNSTFACAIDGAASQPCSSPFEMHVAEGAHTFTVAATDQAGNVDPTPATASWTVDLTPPDTTITKNPPLVDNSVNVEFDFTATEDGSTFQCTLDGGAAAPCATPDMLTALASGAHTFTVAATDPAGNVDPTPATYTWTIDTSTPDTVIDSGPTGSVQATTATFTFHSPNAGAGATFACALDTAAPATCTSPISYNGLAEAAHTFTVAVTNAAGTSDPTPATQTWTVDHTAPTVTITGGPNGPTSDATPTFPFTYAGNPTAIECAVDTAAFAACTSPFTTTSLGDGPHTVHVRVTDAAGNQGSDSRSFTVDTVGPTVTITSGPPSLTNATGATFAFTASESPVTYACAVDGAAFAACTSGVAYTSLADGPHMFAVRATDTAGNTGATAVWPWTIDTVGPLVSIDAPTPSNPTNVTTATFLFHSPDPSATFTCAIDGGAFATCATGQQYTALTGGAGTSHTFQVKATDAAGNTGQAASFTWTIDTQAPTIAIDAPTPASPTNATSATFTFHSPSDANATYQCHLDTASYAACTPGVSYTGLTGGAGTSHGFHVRAIDAAGNVGAGTTFTWTIDTQAPTVVIDAPTPASPTNATGATFTFHSPDGGTSFLCSIDGGAFASCATGKAYAGLAGGAGTSHTFQVEATDDAGNTGAPAAFTWTIDTQAPTVAIDPPTPANPTSATSATFLFHSPDGGTSFTCAIDGGAFASCTTGQAYSSLAGGAGTSHTFQVKATDAAGNTGAPASFTWTIDTQGATVAIDTHPANPTSSTTGAFTFHSPSDAGATFSCSIDGGAFASCATGKTYAGLAGGAGTSHTFQVEATDALGNTGAPASFTWTIDTQGATVAIDTHPANPTSSTTGAFTFHSPSDASATFSCSIDGGAFASCASGQTYTGLAGGVGTSHTFQVEATDALGNTGAPASFTWTIDTQGATVAIDTHPANPTNSTTGAFTFHSPSDASATFSCSIDGGAFASCATGKTYAGLAGGAGTSHTFQVEATDALGNTGAPASFTWAIDTQGATVAIDTHPANPTNSTTGAFTFHSPSDASATFSCSIDGGAFASCATGKTYAGLAGGAGTSHTFQVEATDALGNTGAPASFTWTIDTQGATVAIDTHPANPTNSTTGAFTFHSPSDAGATFSCSIDGGAFAACTSGKTYSGLAGGAGTSHTFQVEATDALGNTGTAASFTWTIDTTAPTVTIDAPTPANPSKTTSATFAFHSPSDANATFTCSIDGGTFAACTSTTAYSGLSGANQTGTSHTFQVKATDAAGNTGTAASFTWTIDTTAPSTTIVSTPVNPSASAAATFTFSANESSTFTCQLDTGTAAACNTGSATYSGLSNATHTFSVYATDTAGNADATPATYSWVVNTGAPTITQAPPSGWTVNYFPFAFTGPVSNPSSYQCSIDGGMTWGSGCTSPRTVASAIYGGVNKFSVRWVDAAGAVSAAATTTWTPNQGLVLYYPFDNDIKNHSILASYYSHDGSGPVSFGGGYAGGALTPLGAVTMKNTVQPLTSASAYTISFWINTFYPSPVGNYPSGPILSTEDATAPAPFGGCAISAGVRAQLPITCSGNPGGTLGSVTAVGTVNVWTNVILSYAGPGSAVQIYVNGNPQTMIANPKQTEVFSALQAANMVVGGTPPAAGLVPIDELRVYNRAYTQSQLCSMLTYGTLDGNNVCHPVLPGDAVSFDPVNNNGILNAGSWGAAVSTTAGTFSFQAGKVGSGIYVKPTTLTTQAVMVGGAAEAITAPAHTVTFWFMDPSGKGQQTVFSDESDAGYQVRAIAGTLQAFGQGQGDTQLVPFSVSIPYTIGKWHQVMIVDNDTVSLAGGKAFGTSEIDIYLDGSLSKIVPISPAASFWTNGTAGPSLGISIGGTTPPPLPDVYVDELKVWPNDLVLITNAQGDQEALCLLAFGGAFDPTTGNCTFP